MLFTADVSRRQCHCCHTCICAFADVYWSEFSCAILFYGDIIEVVLNITMIFCNWLQIRVYRPPDYSNILILGGLFVTIASLVYLKRRNLEFFYNKSAWATFTLASSLSLCIILL